MMRRLPSGGNGVRRRSPAPSTGGWDAAPPTGVDAHPGGPGGRSGAPDARRVRLVDHPPERTPAMTTTTRRALARRSITIAVLGAAAGSTILFAAPGTAFITDPRGPGRLPRPPRRRGVRRRARHPHRRRRTARPGLVVAAERLVDAAARRRRGSPGAGRRRHVPVRSAPPGSRAGVRVRRPWRRRPRRRHPLHGLADVDHPARHKRCPRAGLLPQGQRPGQRLLPRLRDPGWADPVDRASSSRALVTPGAESAGARGRRRRARRPPTGGASGAGCRAGGAAPVRRGRGRRRRR